MKKKMIAVLAMLVLIGLTFVACRGDVPSETQLPPSPEPTPIEMESSDEADDLPEDDTVRTIPSTAREFGEIITRAQELYIGFLSGSILRENAEEMPSIIREGRLLLPFRVSPSSGFESIEDIGSALLPYYTERQVELILYRITGHPRVEKRDGNLYVFCPQSCEFHENVPIWEQANFEIIEQSGNRTTIEATVPRSGLGFDRWTSVEHYTFEYDRIADWEHIRIVDEDPSAEPEVTPVPTPITQDTQETIHNVIGSWVLESIVRDVEDGIVPNIGEAPTIRFHQDETFEIQPYASSGGTLHGSFTMSGNTITLTYQKQYPRFSGVGIALAQTASQGSQGWLKK